MAYRSHITYIDMFLLCACNIEEDTRYVEVSFERQCKFQQVMINDVQQNLPYVKTYYDNIEIIIFNG
jgi:hypothetical protein